MLHIENTLNGHFAELDPVGRLDILQQCVVREHGAVPEGLVAAVRGGIADCAQGMLPLAGNILEVHQDRVELIAGITAAVVSRNVGVDQTGMAHSSVDTALIEPCAGEVRTALASLAYGVAMVPRDDLRAIERAVIAVLHESEDPPLVLQFPGDRDRINVVHLNPWGMRIGDELVLRGMQIARNERLAS